MNSRRSARQMGKLESPMTPRYSTMKARDPKRFWMPPESRARLEYTPPAHLNGSSFENLDVARVPCHFGVHYATPPAHLKDFELRKWALCAAQQERCAATGGGRCMIDTGVASKSLGHNTLQHSSVGVCAS